MVRRRLAYDADPAAFARALRRGGAALAERITAARALLPAVELGDAALRQITAVCAAFEVDGLRADIVMARAAVAHAAWDGRTAVAEEDVRKAARLALPHRRRRNPFDAPGLDEEQLDRGAGGARADQPERRGSRGRRSRRRTARTAAARTAGRRYSRAAVLRPRRRDPPGRRPRRTLRRRSAAARRRRASRRRGGRRSVPDQAASRSPAPATGAAGPPLPAPRRTAGQTVALAPSGRPADPAASAPPHCRPPRRTRWRAGARGPGAGAAPRRPARGRCARAARATWCCSWSTPPARWPPGSG